MELIKNILSLLIRPTSLIAIFFILAFIALILKKNKASRFLVWMGVISFFLFSTNPLIEYLLYKQETLYPPIKTEHFQDIEYIVVLAGGNNPSSHFSVTSELTESTMFRLIEGISIFRQIPKSKIIFTGKGHLKKPEAVLMREVAINLGVSSESILIEDKSMNTFQHTQFLKPILKEKKFILVTSALHMKRAMTLFQSENLNPIPAPTGHLHNIDKKSHYLPDARNLKAFDLYIHELAGLWYYKLFN